MQNIDNNPAIENIDKKLIESCRSTCVQELEKNGYKVAVFPNGSFRAYNQKKDYEIWFACDKDNIPKIPPDLWATNAIYLLLWLDHNSEEYTDRLPAVYVGQTNDIKRRIVKEHTSDTKTGKEFEGRLFDCFLWFRKSKMPLNPIDALNLERELYYMLRGTKGCLFAIRKKKAERQFISTGSNKYSSNLADGEAIFRLQNKEEPSAPRIR